MHTFGMFLGDVMTFDAMIMGLALVKWNGKDCLLHKTTQPTAGLIASIDTFQVA
jgi:hypothetical protein